MIAAVLALIISGCEKPLVEDLGSVGDADGNVLLTVAANETRSVPVGEVCTRLNVAVLTAEVRR